ncbi:hypothetical protein [Duganella violaceipulchra]|uniref:Uncharacterized protein n=1 Tax=Duganella violaceipulchra TaxID=2849652 RepID=A0AA41HCA2_9BURK|nr:hypothetical protein [Duganella violaceicalia]MBV6323465.1 hypothetical protein [Duganella violaceicalia]MCP2007580.1 hypothetical protein [Duganella violaceicalia]
MAEPSPATIILIRATRGGNSQDQLILDQVPVPREMWSYDANDGVLTWRGLFGGGHLLITHNGKIAIGNVRLGVDPIPVSAGETASFDCEVAPDCGIELESSGNRVTNMLWDRTSSSWTQASWSTTNRFNLQYTYTAPISPVDPGSFTFQFTDNDTVQEWQPTDSEVSASLSLSPGAAGMVWNLRFQCFEDPPKSASSESIDTVFPYWMIAQEDAAASTISGAMLIDNPNAETGMKIGFQGVASSNNVAGYYRSESSPQPFAVFGGKLVVAGATIASSVLSGQRLCWSGLSISEQAATGLPENGALTFRIDGQFGSTPAMAVRVARLNGLAALQSLKALERVGPGVAQHLSMLEQAVNDTNLNIQSLLAMTPYARTTKGDWYEAVQQAVTNDLSMIMNSFISSDAWNLIYPNTPQPSLSGYLATIAQTPVAGEDVVTWYQSLGTAVLTQGLSGGTDDNCKYLNGPRSAQWLRTEVAASKVYAAHSQLLFAYHWQEQNALTAEFLQDQNSAPQTYVDLINTKVAAMVTDINTNVAVDPDPTVPDPRPAMIADANAVGKYAVDNCLYWAFGFYYYNTTSNILATLAFAMSDPGSTDGSMLSRLFQTNVAVLTALDPSGTFAQKYTDTLNAFLATNILPSMTSLSSDGSSVSIIELYLHQFVTNNLANVDSEIAAVAAQLQVLLADKDAGAMLKASIEVIGSLSGSIDTTLAFPYVAKNFVNWFQTTYPRFATCSKYFASVLLGGIVALNAFNLITGFKSWDKLSDEERAQLVTNAIQLGLQVLAAVVKRGVRLEIVLTTDGLSAGQRAASIAKIIADGEGGALENALVRTGNATARWLGSTEGTAMIEVSVDGAVNAVMINGADAAVEDATWITTALGKNLDEFIATRIGPVFILAGIGYSLYSIIEGDNGVALAGDILGIVGGAFALFAIAGNWALASGALEGLDVLAAFVPFAGPLAVLAAIAGVALMIYEMMQRPPDPVAEFVDNYAAPAGFKVNSQAGAVDYVAPFANVDAANTMMMGFTFGAANRLLSCGSNGILSWTSQATNLPDTVWQVTTDGSGFSQIFTLCQTQSDASPVVMFLSLMNDGTICFQPKIPPAAAPTLPSSTLHARTSGAADPAIQTQTWQCNPVSDSTLTSDGHLFAISFTVQFALPDAQGNFQAGSSLMISSDGVTAGGGIGAVFDLTLSGMAPNFMQMRNISVLQNTIPDKTETYGPMFGVQPSTPLNFTATGALPGFMSFDSTSCTFSPNGGTSGAGGTTTINLAAMNLLGSQNVDFAISVGAASA